jgi:hypothetical protein
MLASLRYDFKIAVDVSTPGKDSELPADEAGSFCVIMQWAGSQHFYKKR